LNQMENGILTNLKSKDNDTIPTLKPKGEFSPKRKKNEKWLRSAWAKKGEEKNLKCLKFCVQFSKDLTLFSWCASLTIFAI
jgi:hypothetical protein